MYKKIQLCWPQHPKGNKREQKKGTNSGEETEQKIQNRVREFKERERVTERRPPFYQTCSPQPWTRLSFQAFILEKQQTFMRKSHTG